VPEPGPELALQAFRFQIVLDRSGGHAVELESVKVVVRG